MFFERTLYKSNYIIFILSWCGTHTKIRSKLVDIVTAGSQKITFWGPQRTPLGILRVNILIYTSNTDCAHWNSINLHSYLNKLHFSKQHLTLSQYPGWHTSQTYRTESPAQLICLLEKVQCDSFGTRPKKMRISQRLYLGGSSPLCL